MKKINSILVTNDDGYNSYGIKLLITILRKFAKEVFIIAPNRNMSGSSRSITLGKQVIFKKISPFSWVINGTPTDCIIFGLNHIFKNKKPDYIFSGINAGSNIGDEISYSGTVGAAFEGAIRGIPSLAISQLVKHKNHNEYEVVKNKLFKVLPDVLKYFCNNNLLLNLNFPCCALEDVRELKIVRCSNQKQSDELIIDKNNSAFKIGKMNILNDSNLNDLNQLNNNYITLTPILTNLTNVSFLRT